MPRKLIRRWMPDPHKIAQHKGLSWLGNLLDDPNLFHLTRDSVSLAFMIGLFMAFVPIPFQMVVAALLSLWLRANMPIAVALVWITNPLTIPPMFFGAYRVGVLLLGMEPLEFTIDLSWEWLKTAGSQVWLPLLVGSLSCGVAFGAIGYFAIRGLWRWHVVYNWEKRKEARQRQAKRD